MRIGHYFGLSPRPNQRRALPFESAPDAATDVDCLLGPASNFRKDLFSRLFALARRRLWTYFFFPPAFLPGFFADLSSITACAAANRAIGTWNGDALT